MPAKVLGRKFWQSTFWATTELKNPPPVWVVSKTEVSIVALASKRSSYLMKLANKITRRKVAKEFNSEINFPYDALCANNSMK